MTRSYGPPNGYMALIVLLVAASFILIFADVFMIQTLSISYGSGGSASSLAQHSIYTAILSGYIGLLAALGMLLSSALLFRYNDDMMSIEAKGHVNLHGMLTAVYAMLFTLYINSVSVALPMYYLWLVYSAIGLCAVIDLYNIVFMRYLLPRRFAERKISDLSIDPYTPYTNMIRIKDGIFSRLKGKLYIVDKHMNSVGMENFHRLIGGRLEQIPEINIMTSKDMLDGEFSKNYHDWKNEMIKADVKMKVMIMNDDDSMNQHERFIFDDRHAYKVPPFNIIHKKSEHIIKINLKDARKRFEQLKSNSMTYDNFIIKTGQVQPS